MNSMLRTIFLMILLVMGQRELEAHMSHFEGSTSEWVEEQLPPFTEWILTWNADRPTQGNYKFYVSLKTEGWSPWLLYASWGKAGQSSYENAASESSVKSYQDAAETLNGKSATGFKLKIVAEDSADLSSIRSLHAYTNSPNDTVKTNSPLSEVHLDVQGLSQMALNHERAGHLCSPTSTTAVVRYLSHKEDPDPIAFAKNVWDSGFDIYGNWVFNAAQASAELGADWQVWVERLKDFADIHDSLLKGTPVVVSVRGPLPGSAQPYNQGHLMAVIGYDPEEKKVICMDPAFAKDQETIVSYDLESFTAAWTRRGRVAYVFSR